MSHAATREHNAIYRKEREAALKAYTGLPRETLLAIQKSMREQGAGMPTTHWRAAKLDVLHELLKEPA